MSAPAHEPPPQDREAPLLRRQALEGAYRLLTFRHAAVARDARAGQFVMIKAGRSAEPPLRRPFSILAVDPEQDSFTLFVKVVGPGTRALAGLQPGEIARCLGPLGRPFPAPAARRETLLVAGGYGIAPFLLLAASDEQRQGLRVFYGGRSAADLQLRERFDALGVPLVPATEDGSLGHHGRVTEAVEAHLEATGGEPMLYACGPDAMLHAIARLAERRGLPARVSLDPWMGCGFGTCLACVVDVQEPGEPAPRRRCACTEGPVFDAASVVWPGETRSAAARAGGSA
jgi:dihydroorotate dehydrogenase electron transfer subunit